MTNPISLNSLKSCFNELENARCAQIIACRKQTHLMFQLSELDIKIEILAKNHDRLKTEQRNASLAKSNDKKNNYTDIANERSKEVGSLTKDIKIIKTGIEKYRKKADQLHKSIQKAKDDYNSKLRTYQMLKANFEMLSMNNVEWQEWNEEQIKKVEKLALFAEIPREHADTVVIKAGKDKFGGLRLYYGDPDRAYNDNDICNIIREDGSVYYKDSQNRISPIEAKKTEQA